MVANMTTIEVLLDKATLKWLKVRSTNPYEAFQW